MHDVETAKQEDPPQHHRAVIVERIRREASFLTCLGTPEMEPFFQALCLMNWVQTNVNTAQYGYLLREHGELPTSWQEAISMEAGICGDHTAVFVALAQELGLTVRTIQIYWDSPSAGPSSHSAVEVFYNGKWRFFDVSFGTIFRALAGPGKSVPVDEILSLREIQDLPAQQLQKMTNEANAVYVSNLRMNFDPLEYVALADIVLLGNNGTIPLTASSETNQVFCPGCVPEVFGHIPDYPGGPIGISQLALVDAGPATLVTLVVKASGGSGTVVVQRGIETVELPLETCGPAVLEFSLSASCAQGEILLSTSPANVGEAFYVVFDCVVLE
jgi:hypothetical protein